MTITTKDFPQTHDEQKIFDAAFGRGKNWVIVFSALAVPAPLGLVWWPMSNALGPEGAALVVIFVQVAAVVTIPDSMMSYMAHRALRRYRSAARF